MYYTHFCIYDIFVIKKILLKKCVSVNEKDRTLGRKCYSKPKD